MNYDRHIWLISLLRRYPQGITLRNINRELKNSHLCDTNKFNRVTLLRYRNTIYKVFGVNIASKRHAQHSYYYIFNQEVFSRNDMNSWLCSNLITSNLLAGSTSIQDRILPEAIPSNGIMLQEILSAMRDNSIITFIYHKYNGETTTRQAEPYCVKLWNQRWYLLCHNAYTINTPDNSRPMREYAVFSLDRIQQVDATNQHFKMLDSFSPELYFHDCYGILTGDNAKPERIVLQAFGSEANYLRDLPLHHSQRIVDNPAQTDDNVTTFEYLMCPTTDFIDALLSHADRIKVVEPQHLADTIKTKVQSILKLYQ